MVKPSHAPPWVPSRTPLILAPILLASCAPATAQSPPSPAPAAETDKGTIQVTGQAQILVPADRVSISFGVETEAESARTASALNAERMDEVIGAVRRSGVEGLRIETFGYSLNPEYRTPNRGDPSQRTISGYRATNNIRVILPDVGAAGEILDTAIGAGANRVLTLQFEASDTREARLEALREAVGVAQEEAQTIADAMGVTLGPPLEVRGGASPGEPRVLARAAVMDEMAGIRTPIEAGRQTVSASVTVLFRILEETR